MKFGIAADLGEEKQRDYKLFATHFERRLWSFLSFRAKRRIF